MEKFIDDKFMSVFEKNGILNLCWKKDVQNMKNENFKEEALKYINIVKKRNSKKIIVDMREFSFIFNSNLIDWRNKNIVSIYNEIGVEKFAFISEKQTVNQDDTRNTFVTQHFSTNEDAEKWLNS